MKAQKYMYRDVQSKEKRGINSKKNNASLIKN